jgi:K+-transporting ATPase A subunit
MALHSYLQLLLYIVVLLALAKPLGRYMARVYEGQSTSLDRPSATFGWI